MREIISINFGQFGSRIGHLFNQSLAHEHGLVDTSAIDDRRDANVVPYTADEEYQILRSRLSTYFDCSSYQQKLSANGLTTSSVLSAFDMEHATCTHARLQHLHGTEKHLARSIFVDSEHGPIEQILSTASQNYGQSDLHKVHNDLGDSKANLLDIRKLYSPDHFITGCGRPMTTFAEGCSTQPGGAGANSPFSSLAGQGFGAQQLGGQGQGMSVSDDTNSLFSTLMERIRKHAELCDSLQGFQLVFSTAGGMSGLAASTLSELSSLYDERKKFCMVQHPSSAFCSNGCINIYNDILSTNSLIEDADLVSNADDHTMLEVCARRITPMTKYPLAKHTCSNVKIRQRIKPTWQDANFLFVDSMLGITQNFRLPTSQNQTMLKMCYSLIPYARLHLFSISQSFDLVKPLNPKAGSNVQDLIDFQVSELMCGQLLMHSGGATGNVSTPFSAHQAQKNDAIHLTSQLNSRQARSVQSSFDAYLAQHQDSHYSHWLGGSNTLHSYPHFDHARLSNSGAFRRKLTLLEINSQMEDFLRERQNLFRTALSRKLFFHRFQRFGMDEMHFTDAETNVNDLVWEYGSIQQMCRENETSNDQAGGPLFDDAAGSIGVAPFHGGFGMMGGGQVNLDIGDLADDSDEDVGPQQQQPMHQQEGLQQMMRDEEEEEYEEDDGGVGVNGLYGPMIGGDLYGDGVMSVGSGGMQEQYREEMDSDDDVQPRPHDNNDLNQQQAVNQEEEDDEETQAHEGEY